MNYENLIDFPLEALENYTFNTDFFPDRDSLIFLDDYIITNLNRNLAAANKDNLLKLSKVIVNSISFLDNSQFENLEEFRIRWLAFSDLCEKFLETKSGNIAYQEILRTYEKLKRFGYSPKIINYLYVNKVAKISEIERLLGSKMQYASNLIRQFEELGVVTRSSIGKNRLVRLTSIGIEIYKNYTKETEPVHVKNEYLGAFKDDDLKNEIKSNQDLNFLPVLDMVAV